MVNVYCGKIQEVHLLSIVKMVYFDTVFLSYRFFCEKLHCYKVEKIIKKEKENEIY